MKITRRQLRKIIREEKQRLLEHSSDDITPSEAYKELQTILHDASGNMERWIDRHHVVLDAAGELGRDSLAARMEELRTLINHLRDDAYSRR